MSEQAFSDDAYLEFTVLPPKVTVALSRQSEACSVALRKKIGKRLAAERKEAGVVPFARKEKVG